MQTVLEQGSIDKPLTFDVGLIQLSFIPVCSLNTCNISVKLCRGFALQCFSLLLYSYTCSKTVYEKLNSVCYRNLSQEACVFINQHMFCAACPPRGRYLFRHVAPSEGINHQFYRQLYPSIIRDITVSVCMCTSFVGRCVHRKCMGLVGRCVYP